MEISARNSSTKLIAIIILILTILLFIVSFAVAWLVVTNRSLIHDQRTVVTPMTYNAPFAVSETKADTEYFRMMTLSFLALRLNVSPETVDSNHAFLLTFVDPEARAEFKPVLQEEASQIKSSEVNSTFYTTEINVYPVDGRVDVRGVLKMWIGNAKPSTEIKNYRLRLNYTGGFTRIARFYEVTNEK
ncbi:MULTISPECIES: type IV conjugative transfer system protein TraE [Yersiniaceae]|jgi:conjugal transfer pilus assembly protein TraE|uniref:Type IV conjugative transfer system protein TraE n=1 Tax=Yersinia enterocolitica LC20 TaxID=1443113 RepID=A0A7U4GJ84_YEREN|nr:MULTISPECIES: type IV conjugative transfer system protein TraE [Yersiniaceae]AHM76645.1 type IV conjugative transfer system protein TraE [Yersinia hibernica]EKN3637355.1 type IV conjugative transfer system protein TraE [Yersinia enterocolitica]ELI8280714.1 type IV conjugative transfer system protein TraE [Yersinia enterocolitica]MBX9489508.1 type IV conjugative transfer system protein TraE [Yersinia enterocolitica]MBX9492124.1 type IV conjugative transfer system protein TraE [Yersinia enter